jgi:hypothetical protein
MKLLHQVLDESQLDLSLVTGLRSDDRWRADLG